MCHRQVTFVSLIRVRTPHEGLIALNVSLRAEMRLLLGKDARVFVVDRMFSRIHRAKCVPHTRKTHTDLAQEISPELRRGGRDLQKALFILTAMQPTGDKSSRHLNQLHTLILTKCYNCQRNGVCVCVQAGTRGCLSASARLQGRVCVGVSGFLTESYTTQLIQ